MKLYVYCLAEGIDELPEPVSGVSGAGVRLLIIDELGLLVSDLDLEAVPVSRENALAHASVVRSVLDKTTPLPFRFGTLVSQEQLENYVSARKSNLETKLAHVRGCVEMSVKIIWKVTDEEQPLPSEAVEKKGIGAAFLAQKRLEILGDERRNAEANEISEWLRNNLSGLTRDQVVTVRPNERLVMSAAHLVERTKISQYRDRVLQARKDRPELHFLTSGPWPPYSFANIELEFKTRFGVS